MRNPGRTPIPLSESDLVMIDEYLTTTKTAKEVAEAFNVPVSTLRYKVRKYRLQAENQKEGDNH